MRIYYYKNVNSTMDMAKEIAHKGATDWSVIIANSQNRGRGRLGRRWTSPSGNIYLSIILRPGIKVTDIPLLGLFFSAAVADFLKDKFGINAHTKWPNDVLVDSKKICGILIESEVSGNRLVQVILGIGFNLNVTPHPGAISVHQLTRKKYPVRRTAEKLLRFIRKKFIQKGVFI